MPDDAPPTREQSRLWTRIDDYVVALALRQRARQAHRPPPRTEPEDPRFSLSTLPFLILILSLFGMAAAILYAARPGQTPPPKPHVEQREPGTAPRGWLDEAKREFHRG